MNLVVQGDEESGDGVGDDSNSWAYDGVRQQKWNGESSDYGQAWRAGDVVGCLLDLDLGTIRYTLNGEDLGVAFENIDFGIRTVGGDSSSKEGMFPALSLEEGEAARVNIGDRPFMYLPSNGELKYKGVWEALPQHLKETASFGTQTLPLQQEVVKPVEKTSKEATASSPKSSPIDRPEQKLQSPKKRNREESPVQHTAKAVPKAKVPPAAPEPVNLDEYNSVAELEEVGLDRLKVALVARGLKCG